MPHLAPPTLTAAEQKAILRATAANVRDHTIFSMALGTGPGAEERHATADEIKSRPGLQLVLDPELTVVVFRREGWSDPDYTAWCETLLHEQKAFVLPTTWRGERLMRFCFVNPNTTIEDVRSVLDTMFQGPRSRDRGFRTGSEAARPCSPRRRMPRLPE